jgi:Domain of unknown function (DUF4157)
LDFLDPGPSGGGTAGLPPTNDPGNAMTPPLGPPPIHPLRSGHAGVIQGYFPAGKPRIIQTALVAGKLTPTPPSPQAPFGARPGAAARLQAPPAILPSAPRSASPVQPSGGNALALPISFALRPSALGQRLPEAVQQKMESFFNTSFADVRVHVGAEAASIGALAFTHGTNLYFAPGQYNPQTVRGQQLLGHELTHVVQQRAGRVRNPLGTGIAVVQDPGLEAEAERMGLRAATSPIQAKPERSANQMANCRAGLPRRQVPVAGRATDATPGPKNALQMRKPDGFYRLKKDANLRANIDRSGAYRVKKVLPEGSTVYAINPGGNSNFKAGTSWYSSTNEHTWVSWELPEYWDDAHLFAADAVQAEGWIEDGKLENAPPILQEQFQQGDKVYGRHETRYAVTNNREARTAAVRNARFNIIDDINNDIVGGRVNAGSDQEILGFTAYVRQTTRAEPRNVRIRTLCKLGLAHFSQQHTIHFMLDGLDANRVALEAVAARYGEDHQVTQRFFGNIDEYLAEGIEKKCTGSEMRSLMRQRLHDLGQAGGKNHGINLGNVKFYKQYAETPAPWSDRAIPEWRDAWDKYRRYRAERSRMI